LRDYTIISRPTFKRPESVCAASGRADRGGGCSSLGLWRNRQIVLARCTWFGPNRRTYLSSLCTLLGFEAQEFARKVDCRLCRGSHLSDGGSWRGDEGFVDCCRDIAGSTGKPATNRGNRRYVQGRSVLCPQLPALLRSFSAYWHCWLNPHGVGFSNAGDGWYAMVMLVSGAGKTYDNFGLGCFRPLSRLRPGWLAHMTPSGVREAPAAPIEGLSMRAGGGAGFGLARGVERARKRVY